MKKFLYAALATALCVTTNAQPVIRNIVPTTGTAGFGQLITIQGFGLNAANNPVVNFQPQAGGATLHCSFNMPVPNSDNELYFRLAVTGANSCVLPAGGYLLTITTNQGTSSPFFYSVTSSVGTPLVTAAFSSLTAAPITSFRVGDSIIITGFGIDTMLAKVVFRQGATRVAVNATGVAGFAVGARVTVPAGLLPGTVLVQLETTVGGVSNLKPSNSLKLTVNP